MRQLAYQSARDLGCLRAGMTLGADIEADILAAGNAWLDGLLIDGYAIPASPAQVFTLTAGRQIYTIGPSEVAPNFTAARPVEIEDANIVLNTVTPVLRTPLEIINVDQWAAIPVSAGTNPASPDTGLPQTLPTRLYYVKDFNVTTGAGTICLWGGAISAYGLELFSWDQTVLRQFTDLTTAYIYPPGYQRMIQKCLAVEIAPLMTMYSKSARMERPMAPSTDMLQLVMKQANEARAAVESYNAECPILTGDPAFLGQGSRNAWNYLTGVNGRSGR